jgi:hypothetical protein
MTWMDNLEGVCKKYGFEPVNTGETLIVAVPKMPEEEIQKEIKSIIPEGINYTFREAPKFSTMEALRTLFANVGAITLAMMVKKHKLMISIRTESSILTDKDSDVWDFVRSYLTKDKFIEGWKVMVNEEVMSEYDQKIDKALQGRLPREIGVSKDDILNLRIALETCQDVNEFIDAL